jgi:hypothetical protein
VSDADRRVDVALSPRTPNATRTWEDALALGQAVLALHPGIERCRVAVHGDRRAGLRWRIARDSELSLHWALAPHRDAVLAVIEGDDQAWDELQARIPGAPPAAERPRGRVHDLGPLLATARIGLPELGEVRITWGRFGRAPERTLRLGSCSPSVPPLVRIHPVLDHETVPAWFVSFVVFHELLHVVHPPRIVGGRRILHPPELLAAERAHPDHARAVALERQSVREWLQRCRAQSRAR